MLLGVICVAAGGAIGALFRWLISLLLNPKEKTDFPLGTFVINCAGCLLIGLFSAFLGTQEHLSNNLELFLTAGFTGGFTTYSTFMFEAKDLFKKKKVFFAYIILTYLAGILLYIAGYKLGGLF